MAISTFTVGRDASAVAIAPNGSRVDLSTVIDFSHKAIYKEVSSSTLGSPTSKRFLPDGHEITFQLDRLNSSNEALFSQIEAGWWAIGSADSGTSDSGTVYVYITEVDGSVTTHQFRGVAMKFGGIGDFKDTSAIKQTITAHAQYWTKV